MDEERKQPNECDVPQGEAAQSVPPDFSAGTPPGERAAETETLRGELAAMKDRYLRTHAELDNYRKRAQRELADQRRYANIDLLRDLLPVLDNVDRAIQAAEKTRDPDSLLQGFKMVAQQIERLLDQYQCKPLAALHTAFDPRMHEAILQVPDAEHPDRTVVQVAVPGYVLHDRVGRPSQVVVSARPEEPAGAPSPDSENLD